MISKQAYLTIDFAKCRQVGKTMVITSIRNTFCAEIVRNRLKIEASIQNAEMFLAVQNEFGTFDEYIWGFVGNEPKQNAWKSMKEVPAKTPESDAMSKEAAKNCQRCSLMFLDSEEDHHDAKNFAVAVTETGKGAPMHQRGCASLTGMPIALERIVPRRYY